MSTDISLSASVLGVCSLRIPYLPSPSAGTWVSMVGVGLEPSSGLRVRKKMKETTIIEVNTIYSP